jgi:hypothetical protein
LQIPFTFLDISLWLAVTSITLFITAELASTYYGQTRLYINRRRLERTALAFGTLFMITVAINIIGLVTS